MEGPPSPPSDETSYESSLELVSSHLHRLQLAFNQLQASFQQLQASHRDLLDRVPTLERGRSRDSARLAWVEHWIEFVRNLARRLGANEC